MERDNTLEKHYPYVRDFFLRGNAGHQSHIFSRMQCLGMPTQPALPDIKAAVGESRQTMQQHETHEQPPSTSVRERQDGAQANHWKHLEPRDARVKPDEVERRHHLLSTSTTGNASLSTLDKVINGFNDAVHHATAPDHQANGTPVPDPASKFEELRNGFSKSVLQLKKLLKAMRDPLPTESGNGDQLLEEQKESTVKMLEEVFSDLRLLGPERIGQLTTIAKKALTHSYLDDKKYYMERLIQSASMLPPDDTQEFLTDKFVTQLWNDLEHPPQTLLSDEYQFRQPDGSSNNLQYPHIGKANMPYARTVAPKMMQPGTLPDPGVLFDSVMARKVPNGTTHPNKISSLLFYLASIIIHDVFKTDHRDFAVSNTSSYLDLSPLYGNTWDEQKRIRTFQDGKIKPDCFSETRLLTFPPGVGAILIMFNRYHNYVVEQLAAINEDGRFTENPRKVTVQRYGEKLNKRDDDLFQTARLITCGLYINIILIDYVRTILNLNRTDENWQLNPRVVIEDGPPLGIGNQVSAEFNLVYRWHSAMSERDDKWSQQLFKEIVPNMSAAEAAESDKITDFLVILARKEAEFTAQDPTERQFPALKEEKLERIREGPFKGNFKDDDLAAILTAGIEDCANAMGPQQVPTVMKAIEILGIRQARTWKMATLNEFRKHFALEPHRTFSDITDNAEVAEALKHLYDTPDHVELYPGLVVEDAKRPILPGSGLCPSYSVSRAVLSDAVALVRGDRHYTTNYTPATLTSWGYQEASFDLTIDNGCVFYKLFLRALPNNYDPASIYVHYPLTIPHGQDGMAETLQRLGKADKYTNLTEEDRPQPIAQPTVIFGYDAAVKVMERQDVFKVTWGKAMEYLMGPAAKNFMLSGDSAPNAKSRELMEKALYLGGSSRSTPTGNENWLNAVKTFYTNIITRLLKEKSYSLADKKYVDIIRDVGNMAHVHFSAELFSLPLKTVEFPKGIMTEKQMYMIMAAVFTCVFFDVDPPKSFSLRQQARDATQQLGQFVQAMVKIVQSGGDLAEWVGEKFDPTAPELRKYGIHMIHQLVTANPDVEDLVWGNIMGTTGGMVANQGQLFGQAMDWFMQSANKEHWQAVQLLAREDTEEAEEKLMHYVMEASRLNGETGVFRYVELPPGQESVEIVDSTKPLGEKVYQFKNGDRIMVNLKAASRDPTAFPNPDSVDLKRPLDSYIHLGHGPHQCLGLPMTRVALTTMLKVIARLDNLQPAPVSVGSNQTMSSVKKVAKEFVPGDLAVLPEEWHYHQFLTEDWDMYFPFPTSLKVTFSGSIPDARTTATADGSAD